jgi:DNA repair protein RecN (Recombination protein N)
LLVSLTIRNFVLIEDAVLELEPGLNVLTGETGAGKTLLTKALGLLMGERAEEGLVGTGGSEATIQAVFELDEGDVSGIPEEVREAVGGIEIGELVVTRRLGKEGRNRCYVNESAVTLAMMGNVVAGLLSFAGQHEYRRLLDPRYQLSVLDQWAGADVGRLADECRAAYTAARDSARRLDEGRRQQESRLREIDLLRFQVRELAEARLSTEEEEELLAEQRLLSRAEEVLRAIGSAAETLRGDDDRPDVETLLVQACAWVAGVAGVDQALAEFHVQLTDLQYRVSELARELHGYAGRVVVDPARLGVVDERLRLYTDLARKYGGSTEAALARLADASLRLQELEDLVEDLARLEEVRTAEAAHALELAEALSERRFAAAPRLEEAVATQLADLGMPLAAVRVALTSSTGWEGMRENGLDAVEFLLAANPGQPARSLARTASGGELSRVLLAIKCALAGAGGHETLVFDEVDAGIGGRTAVAVANKLRQLAGHSQLIVITHLAQVAALARRHYLIDKVSDAEGTVTRLSVVEGDAVVAELCRMLGGRPGDAEAMAHARDLRDRAATGLID